MKGSDIRLSFFILVVFLLMFFATILSVGIKKFKENWPRYKCNPAAMPFAGYLGYNAMDNFVECISTIQSGLMGRFLAPIFTMTKFMTQLAGNLMGNIAAIQSTVFNLKNVMNTQFEHHEPPSAQESVRQQQAAGANDAEMQMAMNQTGGGEEQEGGEKVTVPQSGAASPEGNDAMAQSAGMLMQSRQNEPVGGEKTTVKGGAKRKTRRKKSKKHRKTKRR